MEGILGKSTRSGTPRRLLIDASLEQALRPAEPLSDHIASSFRQIRKAIAEWNVTHARLGFTEPFIAALSDIVEHSIHTLPKSVLLCDVVLWAWVFSEENYDQRQARLQCVLQVLVSTLEEKKAKYTSQTSPFCVINIIAARRQFPSLQDLTSQRIFVASAFDKFASAVSELPVSTEEQVSLTLDPGQHATEDAIRCALRFLTLRNHSGLCSKWIYDLLVSGTAATNGNGAEKSSAGGAYDSPMVHNQIINQRQVHIAPEPAPRSDLDRGSDSDRDRRPGRSRGARRSESGSDSGTGVGRSKKNRRGGPRRQWVFQDVKVTRGWIHDVGVPIARQCFIQEVMDSVLQQPQTGASMSTIPAELFAQSQDNFIDPVAHVNVSNIRGPSLIARGLTTAGLDDKTIMVPSSESEYESSDAELQSDTDNYYLRTSKRDGMDFSKPSVLDASNRRRPRPVKSLTPPESHDVAMASDIPSDELVRGFAKFLEHAISQLDSNSQISDTASAVAITHGGGWYHQQKALERLNEVDSEASLIASQDANVKADDTVTDAERKALVAELLLPRLPTLWRCSKLWTFLPAIVDDVSEGMEVRWKTYTKMVEVFIKPLLKAYGRRHLAYSHLVESCMKHFEGMLDPSNTRRPEDIVRHADIAKFVGCLLVAVSRLSWSFREGSNTFWSVLLNLMSKRFPEAVDLMTSSLMNDPKLFKELFHPPRQVVAQRSLDYLVLPACNISNFIPTCFMWIRYMRKHADRSGSLRLTFLEKACRFQNVKFASNKDSLYVVMVALIASIDEFGASNQQVAKRWIAQFLKDRVEDIISIRKSYAKYLSIQIKGFWYFNSTKKSAEVTKSYRMVGVMFFLLIFSEGLFGSHVSGLLLRHIFDVSHGVVDALNQYAAEVKPDVVSIMRDLLTANIVRVKNVVADVSGKVEVMASGAIQERMKVMRQKEDDERADFLGAYAKRRVVELIRNLDIEGLDYTFTEEETAMYKEEDNPQGEIRTMTRGILTDSFGGKVDPWGRYMDYALWGGMPTAFLGGLHDLFANNDYRTYLVRIILNTAALFNFVQLEKTTTPLSETTATLSLSIFHEVLSYLIEHRGELNKQLLSRGIFKWLLSIVVEAVPKNLSRKKLDFMTVNKFLRLLAGYASGLEGRKEKFTSVGNDIVRLIMMALDRVSDEFYTDESERPRKSFVLVKAGPIASLTDMGGKGSVDSLEAKTFLIDHLVVDNALSLMSVSAQFRRIMSLRMLLDVYKRLGLRDRFFRSQAYIEQLPAGADIAKFAVTQRPDVVHLAARLLDIWSDVDDDSLQAILIVAQAVVEGFIAQFPRSAGVSGLWLFNAHRLEKQDDGGLMMLEGGIVGQSLPIMFCQDVVEYEMPTVANLYLGFVAKYLEWSMRYGRSVNVDNNFNFEAFIDKVQQQTAEYDNKRKWELVGADDRFYDPPDEFTVEDSNLRASWSCPPSKLEPVVARVNVESNLGVSVVRRLTELIKQRMDRRRDKVLQPMVNKVLLALRQATEKSLNS